MYDAVLTVNHPVLSVWNQQNQTPSPPPGSYVAGFGLILAFAIIGIVRERPWKRRAGRLLVAWFLVNVFLLYAPFNLQRRLSLGLFLPLAALAALGLRSVAGARPRLRWITAAVIVFSLPSNLIAMAAGLAEVAGGAPAVLMTKAELTGYRWVGANLAGVTVLAAPVTGNRLPAYAEVDVLYGHPFETPAAELWEARVRSYYGEALSPRAAAAQARALGADYVVVGPHEARLGYADGITELPLVYEGKGFQVHEVPNE